MEEKREIEKRQRRERWKDDGEGEERERERKGGERKGGADRTSFLVIRGFRHPGSWSKTLSGGLTSWRSPGETPLCSEGFYTGPGKVSQAALLLGLLHSEPGSCGE